ncbi:hypothetical protein FRC08_017898, partial [Ceratobasidium sp. 394]
MSHPRVTFIVPSKDMDKIGELCEIYARPGWLARLTAWSIVERPLSKFRPGSYLAK